LNGLRPHAAKIPFKFDGSAISLPIELDGKPLYAELDTGAPVSTIAAPMALQMFGLSPGADGVDLYVTPADQH